jgi:hypothetical protein
MALSFPSYYATDEKNDEARMSNDERMPDRAHGIFRHSCFVIDSSFVIRISSFAQYTSRL